MFGIIKRINKGVKFNPEDAFDPTTHIATEENFIKFLQSETYDSKYIGYKVQLSNSVDYNNGIWIIADVNHNANQPNTYDLIPQDCFYSRSFGGSQYWRNSTVRTWLNDTFYNGFSADFKSHMNNITYDSNGSTYNDDKVILPSFTEVNGNNPTDYSSYSVVEGTAYPIFTNSDSRKKYQTGTTTYRTWWTRSRRTSDNSIVWFVYTDGGMNVGNYSNSYYLAPILRVS